MNSSNNKPVELVVFDFDGTCLSGHSPALLVRHLLVTGMLKRRLATSLAAWALRYKLQLPQNESWVRGVVFSAFEGKSVHETDTYLRAFYDEKLEHKFREMADRAIQRHLEAGREVWMVSATFEPIADRAAELHGFSRAISTRMRKNPDGTYTREVEGLPVEGEEKLRLVTEQANAQFGEGNWQLAYAYGDHHSDRTLLAASTHPCAVTPDNPLQRTAKENGWTILNWKN